MGHPANCRRSSTSLQLQARPASHQKHAAAKDSYSSCSRISSVTYAAPTPPGICTKNSFCQCQGQEGSWFAATICSCRLPNFDGWNNSSVSTNIHACTYMRVSLSAPPRPSVHEWNIHTYILCTGRGAFDQRGELETWRES